MRTVFGGSAAGARKIGGQISQAPSPDEQSQQKQGDKPDRIVRRINGDRIRFADLARFAWPAKTESHLAHCTGYDARTCRRWLAGDNEPPADKAKQALAAWSAGKDTLDIARMLGLPESVVANELPKFLERRRLAKAFTAFRASRAPADRGEAGMMALALDRRTVC